EEPHSPPPLLRGHERADLDAPADRLDVVRIDEHGLAQLLRGAGELREEQHAVLSTVAGDVLLGNEVHAVAQRRHEPDVRRHVVGDEGIPPIAVYRYWSGT